MPATNEHHNLSGSLGRFFLHLSGIIALFLLAVLIRYPALVNAEYFLGYDEAFMAVAVMELMNGGPMFFFYEGANYHGVLGGITAIPFMWFLGIGSLAYKLPGSLYYSLYIWSCFLLAREIAPRAAFLVVLLMLFPPVAILEITLRNWPHTEISFIGNILFLLFIKAQAEDENRGRTAFFLGAVMGFAIYSYTYAVLHVFAVLILFILTHERWEYLRPYVSFKAFSGMFKNLAGKGHVLARVLDVVIVLFCGGIIFSYVFGGFGLDIAGHSILQINKLHKPVFQLAIVLALRLMIRRDDAAAILLLSKQWFRSLNPDTKRAAGFGVLGFLIGLSPRIAAIVTGDIKRGGQGFDMDFMPVKLAVHFWSLVTEHLPRIFGLHRPVGELFSSGLSRPSAVIAGFLALVVLGVVLWSVISLFISRKEDVRRIIKFQKVSFQPVLLLGVFAALVMLSVIVTQHGPVTRYLYPLFGVAAICAALALDKLRRVSLLGCVFLTMAWVGFYMVTTYEMYKGAGVMNGVSVLRSRVNILNPAVDFFKSNNIQTVYTGFMDSSSLTFLSGGEVVGVEYSKSVRGKKQKARSAADSRFAVLLSNGNKVDRETFQNYLSENGIDHRTDRLGSYLILWDFKGETGAVDGLRSLIG